MPQYRVVQQGAWSAALERDAREGSRRITFRFDEK